MYVMNHQDSVNNFISVSIYIISSYIIFVRYDTTIRENIKETLWAPWTVI